MSRRSSSSAGGSQIIRFAASQLLLPSTGSPHCHRPSTAGAGSTVTLDGNDRDQFEVRKNLSDNQISPFIIAANVLMSPGWWRSRLQVASGLGFPVRAQGGLQRNQTRKLGFGGLVSSTSTQRGPSGSSAHWPIGPLFAERERLTARLAG